MFESLQLCCLCWLQKPGVLELVQQRQLATPDDVFYVSTGRWYTHNCSDFEAPPFNQSLLALATHYKVGRRTATATIGCQASADCFTCPGGCFVPPTA
jgi:hypothetical protein